MAKQYFCISDIHSGYTPMKKALWEAGYRKGNPNHILIICGDLFDRLHESVEVYNFIKSIPKNRRVLIRGNHEDLLLDLLEKDFPDSYDFSNGTVRTICDFTGYSEQDLQYGGFDKFNDYTSIVQYRQTLWNSVKEDFKNLPVYKFVKDKKNWYNYYELDQYIFVHSFIPADVKEEYSYFKTWPHYNLNPQVFCPMKNWRTVATEADWYEARWGNPWKQFQLGLFDDELQNGKILVTGHWYTSDYFHGLDHDDTVSIDECPLYNNHGLIGLDACTAHTNRCNVLKIEKE